MVAAQRGEDQAYKQLFHELDVWLRGYYAKRLPGPEADDARQEALLAIHSERDVYVPSKPFGPWVAAIARYKWIDQLRTTYRFAASSLDDEIAKECHGEKENSAMAVEDHGEAAISSVTLERLLRHLSPGQATVIRLVKLRGVSIEAASDATGQSVPLVKVNIHRGLRKLAELVGRGSAARGASSSVALHDRGAAAEMAVERAVQAKGHSQLDRCDWKCGQQ
jgi:RNA polymerase sigma factor (sigma-70 family)